MVQSVSNVQQARPDRVQEMEYVRGVVREKVLEPVLAILVIWENCAMNAVHPDILKKLKMRHTSSALLVTSPARRLVMGLGRLCATIVSTVGA